MARVRTTEVHGLITGDTALHVTMYAHERHFERAQEAAQVVVDQPACCQTAMGTHARSTDRLDESMTRSSLPGCMMFTTTQQSITVTTQHSITKHNAEHAHHTLPRRHSCMKSTTSRWASHNSVAMLACWCALAARECTAAP